MSKSLQNAITNRQEGTLVDFDSLITLKFTEDQVTLTLFPCFFVINGGQLKNNLLTINLNVNDPLLENIKLASLSLPFYKSIDAQKSNSSFIDQIIQDKQLFYIQSSTDRVTVFLSLSFNQDLLLAKLFLNELVDVRRNIHNAPSVFITKDFPNELKGKVKEVVNEVGFVAFGMFFIQKR